MNQTQSAEYCPPALPERRVAGPMAVCLVLRDDHVGRVLDPEAGLLVVVRYVAADVDVMGRRALTGLRVDLDAVAAVPV